MLPIVTLEGTPFEQGIAHGRELKERIAHNLEIYFERFQSEGKITEDEVLRRAKLYWDVILDKHPHYADSIRGISEATGFDIYRLTAVNVRYEILYHQFTANALVDGCTSFAITPERSENGHLWIGENWDWIPQVKGALLHIKENDTEIVSFTEAGIVGGKIGFNSHGLGLAINGIMSTGDDWSRLESPFHVRCYEILRKRTLLDAKAVITEGIRSCSANYLVAHVDDGVVNIESAPDVCNELAPENGFVAHTNHFVDPAGLGIEEPPSEKRPHSQHRLSRSNELLTGNQPVGFEKIKEILNDKEGLPYSICRHIDTSEPPSEHYQTVTSVIMDINERAIWITDGPPSGSPYQEYKI